MPRSTITYNVRPRYTAGSPAAVDEVTARRVAEEERTAYEHAISGAYGEEQTKRAKTLGLGPVILDSTPCLICGIQLEKHPKNGFFPKFHVFDGVKRSIAEETEEHANHWLVRDFVTGEVYQRPFTNTTETQRKNMVKCTRCIREREARLCENCGELGKAK